MAQRPNKETFTCCDCHREQSKTLTFDRRNRADNLSPVMNLKNFFTWGTDEACCRECWES